MYNAAVDQLLIECRDDLIRVKAAVDGLGMMSTIVPYLNKYSIIRACGAVEVSFKSIIVDYCEKPSKVQVKKYLRRYVRDSSKNPSYKNICALIKEFDDGWHTQFKSRVNAHADCSRIKTSMESLVAARNEFAHGGNPGSTVADVQAYFADFRLVLDIMDDIIH